MATPTEPDDGDGDGTGAQQPIGGLTHVVIGVQCGESGITVTAYDSASGTVESSHFIAIAKNVSTGLSCDGAPGYAYRQVFSKDYSRLAVTISGDDGSSHIGYIDSRTGDVNDLEPSDPLAFSDIVADDNAVFDPKSGRVFFLRHVDSYDRTPPKLMSVDVETKKVVAEAQTSIYPQYLTDFIMSGSSGYLAVAYQSGYPLPSINGCIQVSVDTSSNLIFYGQGPCKGYKSPFKLPHGPANISQPLTWTGGRNVLFLSSDYNGKGPAVIATEFRPGFGSIAHTTELFTLGKRAISFPVLSPDGLKVAFTATAGKVGAMYVASSSRQSQPQVVVRNISNTKLLEWR